eukprot:9682197-Alexandrium_andersonii.AAC.1
MFRKSQHVVYVTEYEDFSDAATVAVAMRSIRGAGDVFFYSSPRAGGSSWQRINSARALRTQNLSYAQKLVAHYDLHWKPW